MADSSSHNQIYLFHIRGIQKPSLNRVPLHPCERGFCALTPMTEGQEKTIRDFAPHLRWSEKRVDAFCSQADKQTARKALATINQMVNESEDIRNSISQSRKERARARFKEKRRIEKQKWMERIPAGVTRKKWKRALYFAWFSEDRVELEDDPIPSAIFRPFVKAQKEHMNGLS